MPSRSSASTPAPLLALEDFLPYRLSVLSNRVSQRIADAYRRRFGLSIWEWRIMAILGRHPGLSAGDVVERTAMDKVMVSRAVASLLAKGAIVRAFDAADRRRSVLKLSPRGYGTYREIAPLALEKERVLLKSLTGAERRALSRLLAKLEQAADAL